MKPLAKNVPAKSEWLFEDDLNKRIYTISSTNTALTASSRAYYYYYKYLAKQVAINDAMVQKTSKLPGWDLLKGRGGQQSRARGFTETRRCK